MAAPRDPVWFGLLVVGCLAMLASTVVDPERRYVYMFLLLLGLVGIWREMIPPEEDDGG